MMIKQAKRAGLVANSMLMLAMAGALSGCALGIGPESGALSGSFEAPVGYKQAYQSALEQARQCLLVNGAYRAQGRVDDAAHGGRLDVVSVLFESKGVARVEFTALGNARTRVRVDMWGETPWDVGAMRAMHDAIYFGVPSCVAYMPGPDGGAGDAWFAKK